MKLDYAVFWRKLPKYPVGVTHRTDNEFLVAESNSMKDAADNFLQEHNVQEWFRDHHSDDQFLLLSYKTN